MEHTNKDQTEISRDTVRPSSKTIAMGLPEILDNVFSFMDQHTLENCLQVSRFWYTHGRTLAWQAFSIDISLFPRLDDIPAVDTDRWTRKLSDKDKSKDKDRSQGFTKNCHHIRSLTLTTHSYRLIKYKLPDTLHPRVAGLKNLNHFAVESERTSSNSTNTYRLAGAILSQNPGIQEIDWLQNVMFHDTDLTDLVLRRVVGGKLKKLTIDADFGESYMLFLMYLIDANKEQQKRLEQEQKQHKGVKLALMDESNKDETESKNEDNSSGGDHGFALEELVLRDYRERSKARWDWLYDRNILSGNMPIRSFSLVNFEPLRRDGLFPDDDEYDEDYRNEDYGIGNSIIPILYRCPDLEKLCVSFDRHPVLPENSPCTFLDNLAKNSHYSCEPSTNRVGKENRRFVEQMYLFSSKLRQIEFGMFYQLTSEHWIEMMEKYRPRLQSLSIWGNVTAFNSKAFMTLLGIPSSNFRRDETYALTRLNINGMKHLHECAFMALYLLPHLKEFRARDVPLDARPLTEEKWACQGLEVLEIFVTIPKRVPWHWDKGHVWVNGFERDRGDIGADWNDASNKDEDEKDETLETLKRRVEYSISEGPRKKPRQDSTKYINTQIKVCKALGRLTQLKELRIEGGRYFESGKYEWGCLELTLETGLEHLAPLRHNLERLIVSGLDESIGRKEVEWIAWNWVHHSNRPWLEHHASQQSMEQSEGSKAARWPPNDDVSFGIRSKFKALIGISGEGEVAMSNIKWLREQCPTLSVIEVE